VLVKANNKKCAYMSNQEIRAADLSTMLAANDSVKTQFTILKPNKQRNLPHFPKHKITPTLPSEPPPPMPFPIFNFQENT
jgi:hypothetical protein